MNDIDGGGGMLIIQFLILLGAVGGHLEFCMAILMAEFMLVILAMPFFILWIIKTIFDTAAAAGVGSLATELFLWILYEDKKVQKKFRKMGR